MKTIIYNIFFTLIPCLAWAQYLSNDNQKIKLGEQTTADGLIWRGVAADTTLTAKSDTAAYFVLDTVNLNLYTYKISASGRKWRQLGADTAAIAYVNIYGTQTVNGLKTFTDTMRVEDAIKVGANNAYVYSAGTGNYYFTKDFKNQSGNHFIIIGDGTMSNATTVSNPTSSRVGGVAIGYNVMKNLSQSASTNNGVYNSGVGYGALESVTTGNFNTAFGHLALNKLTTGGSNAALGTSTLENATTTSSTLGIGDGALRFLTSGSDNVAIGSNAGTFDKNDNQLNTINQSVLIGRLTKPTASSTNEIVIGYGAIGQGSNTIMLGNSSITKTILNGNVGIGTTNPLGLLEARSTVGGTNNGLFSLYENSATSPYFTFRKARGTPASPSAVQLNDGMGDLTFTGYAYSSFNSAVVFRAYNHLAPGAAYLNGGLKILINSQANGGLVEYLNIISNGNTAIGDNLVPTERLHVGGNGLFTGSVTASGKFESNISSTNTNMDNNSNLRLINTGTATLNQRVDIVMRFQDGVYNGTGGISMIRESATGRSSKFVLQPIQSDGNNLDALSIASTGAATFTGSVDATRFNPTASTVTGTGMYLPAANTLGFSTNGFQRMHIKSNGDVGFGAIPFPDYNFQVSTNSGSGNEVIFVVNNSGTTPSSATTARFDFGVFSDPSNYVASNTILGQTNFIGQANDARYIAGRIDLTVTNAGNVGRAAGHSGIMRFYTKPTNGNGVNERMKINEVGEVTINNLAGINDVGADANGKLQAATSDMNLKNTIENSPFGLNEILLLNPVTFLYNDTNRKIDSDVKEVGFIAQDVFDIIPNAVSSTGTGDLQLDYRAITATLTKAIQEQTIIIKQLEERIKKLEER